MDDSSLERLVTMARVNLEQAQAASRVTIFINVTVIIAFMVISNQLFPGWIQMALGADNWYSGGVLGVLVAFGLVGAYTSAYSWGGVASARDLLNLLELRATGLQRRSASERSEVEEGDPVSDLRKAQLSDL